MIFWSKRSTLPSFSLTCNRKCSGTSTLRPCTTTSMRPPRLVEAFVLCRAGLASLVGPRGSGGTPTRSGQDNASREFVYVPDGRHAGFMATANSFSYPPESDPRSSRERSSPEGRDCEREDSGYGPAGPLQRPQCLLHGGAGGHDVVDEYRGQAVPRRRAGRHRSGQIRPTLVHAQAGRVVHRPGQAQGRHGGDAEPGSGVAGQSQHVVTAPATRGRPGRGHRDQRPADDRQTGRGGGEQGRERFGELEATSLLVGQQRRPQASLVASGREYRPAQARDGDRRPRGTTGRTQQLAGRTAAGATAGQDEVGQGTNHAPQRPRVTAGTTDRTDDLWTATPAVDYSR